MADTLIIRIGRALWGDHWAPQMARSLHIGSRTTRRFEPGTQEAPEGILRDLRPVLIERRRELDRLLAELPE